MWITRWKEGRSRRSSLNVSSNYTFPISDLSPIKFSVGENSIPRKPLLLRKILFFSTPPLHPHTTSYLAIWSHFTSVTSLVLEISAWFNPSPRLHQYFRSAHKIAPPTSPFPPALLYNLNTSQYWVRGALPLVCVVRLQSILLRYDSNRPCPSTCL